MERDPAGAAGAEAFFRDVNERIAEATAAGELDASEFVCECDDPECTERLHIRLAEYDEVRSEPARFIVKRDHVEPEIERVVDVEADYTVVEKDGPQAADVAEDSDPRS